ncbi:peptidoglycan-binding domain-containing protein [Marinobacter sp.]|uniref:peptidoglycan-binding domain-containing protein n=1 Tax=Marinobacter sp. TaxID=50741 RepID=UPI002B267D6B|nr:peptidoglycan-binding domain-containing protein [Marinobacter sp.]
MKTVARHFGKSTLLVGAITMAGLASSAQANDTVALKHALYGAGYNITNVSPAMDDTTRAELVRFQKDQGLKSNGIVTEETEKALGMVPVQLAASTSGGSAAPAPASSAESEKAVAKPAAEKSEETEKDDGAWSLW